MNLSLIRRFTLAVTILLVLVGCGNDDSVDQVEPSPTAGPPTAAPGQLTVRDIVGEAEDAWPNVSFMRMTSQSGPIPREGDEPGEFTGSVQEWSANGNRHIIEFQDGDAVNEQIYADGVVYMRGQFVSAAVAPEVGTDTWVILDTEVVPADTPVGIQIRYLTREQSNPYGDITEQLMDRPVQESGTVTVGNRSCTLYTFGDETNSGTEIQHELAIDEFGLPCQIVQRAGDLQNSTVYEFNIDGGEVVAPIEDATPVSGTPEG